MSTHGRSDPAINNNAKLFPVFARKLSNTDPVQYKDTTAKLAKWLGDAKAYYATARPKIIELLEIAEATVKKAIPEIFEPGTPLDRTACPLNRIDLFDAYITLICSIEPFYKLFPEVELRQRLHNLLVSVGAYALPTPPATARLPPSTSQTQDTPISVSNSTTSVTAQHGSPPAHAGSSSTPLHSPQNPTSAPSNPLQIDEMVQQQARRVSSLATQIPAHDSANISLGSNFKSSATISLTELYPRDAGTPTQPATLVPAPSVPPASSSLPTPPTWPTPVTPLPPAPPSASPSSNAASAQVAPARLTSGSAPISPSKISPTTRKFSTSTLPKTDFMRRDLEWYISQKNSKQQSEATSPVTPVAPTSTQAASEASNAPPALKVAPASQQSAIASSSGLAVSASMPNASLPKPQGSTAPRVKPPLMTRLTPPASKPTSPNLSTPTPVPPPTLPTSVSAPVLSAFSQPPPAPPPPNHPLQKPSTPASISAKLQTPPPPTDVASVSSGPSAFPPDHSPPNGDVSAHRDLKAVQTGRVRLNLGNGKSLSLLSRTSSGSVSSGSGKATSPPSPKGKEVANGVGLASPGKTPQSTVMDVDLKLGPSIARAESKPSALPAGAAEPTTMDVDSNEPAVISMEMDGVPATPTAPERPATPRPHPHSEATSRSPPYGQQNNNTTTLGPSISSSSPSQTIALMGQPMSRIVGLADKMAAPPDEVSSSSATTTTMKPPSPTSKASSSAGPPSISRQVVLDDLFGNSAGPARPRKRAPAPATGNTLPEQSTAPPSRPNAASGSRSPEKQASPKSFPPNGSPKKVRLRIEPTQQSADAFAWTLPTEPQSITQRAIQSAIESLSSESAQATPALAPAAQITSAPVKSSAPTAPMKSSVKSAGSSPTAALRPVASSSKLPVDQQLFPPPPVVPPVQSSTSVPPLKRSRSPAGNEARAVRRRSVSPPGRSGSAATTIGFIREQTVSTLATSTAAAGPQSTAPSQHPSSIAEAWSPNPSQIDRRSAIPALLPLAVSKTASALNDGNDITGSNAGLQPSGSSDSHATPRASSVPAIDVKVEQRDDDDDDDEEMVDEMVDELSVEPEQTDQKLMVAAAMERGRSGRATFQLQFELDAAQWGILSKWTNALKHTEDVSKAMCLSLACYAIPETAAKMQPKTFHDEVIKPGRTVSWASLPPGLWLSINESTTLPFPPLLPIRDGLIDLSKFFRLGTNTIQFHHEYSLADKLFILLAHYPTPPQLQEVEAVREQERAWQVSVTKMCSPLSSVSISSIWDQLEGQRS